jgi:hypothetical protein
VSRCQVVKDAKQTRSGLSGLRETRPQRIFYAVFLPLGAVVNVALGVVILSWLNPPTVATYKWMLIVTGVFCCFIGGWLAAAAWSKSYWNRSMARQVAVWRRIADTFFVWLEDAPVPAESLHGLKSSLEEVVPSTQHR